MLDDLLTLGAADALVGDVLKSATAAGRDVRARHRDSIGARSEYLVKIGFCEPSPGLTHPRADLVAWGDVAHEYDEPVKTGDTLTTKRQILNFEIK